LDRVREVAAKAFSEQTFEKVSIASIAAEAHCSTATIYQVYGSKQGLFLEAAAYSADIYGWPVLRPGEPGSLSGLLGYACDRIDYLSSMQTYGYLRSGAAEKEFRAFAQSALTQCNPFVGVTQEVRRAMDAGLLRRTDALAAAYAICAGVGFEAVTHGLLFGSDATVDRLLIVRLIFTPLVTRKGCKQLEIFTQPKALTGGRADTGVTGAAPWLPLHDYLQASEAEPLA
jgi:AcrR family transcriptional regulator